MEAAAHFRLAAPRSIDRVVLVALDIRLDVPGRHQQSLAASRASDNVSSTSFLIGGVLIQVNDLRGRRGLIVRQDLMMDRNDRRHSDRNGPPPSQNARQQAQPSKGC